MKIIDGHKLIEKLRKYHHENVSVDGLEALIDQMSSAQPEIICCGECMHKDKKIDYCHYLGITICESDYCSYAERRTDDKTNKGSSC